MYLILVSLCPKPLTILGFSKFTRKLFQESKLIMVSYNAMCYGKYIGSFRNECSTD